MIQSETGLSSYNGAYLAWYLRYSTQIQPYGWISDTLEPLDETAKKED